MMGAAGQGGEYDIDQSIRFNDDDSASLSRTSGSADSERKLASTSVWLKRSNLTSRHTIYAVNPAGSAGAANQITMVFENSGSNGDCITYNNGSVNRQSTSVYRDVSAWYHLCQIFDTTQSTAADRVKTYINGTLLTDINIGQDFSLNSNTAFGQTGVVHYLGRGGSTQYFDGYMAEIIFTVGQSVTVANFGETNDDGVWIPKKYTGAFGTNGFFIDGRDSSDLGDDESGNGNDFTSSGLAADDQRGDTPTANHATWNPLFFRRTGSYKPVFANGNLYVAGQSSQVSHTGTTIASTGKHYAEFLVNNGSSTITGPGVVRTLWDGGLANSYASNFGGSYYADDGTRYYNATSDSQTAPGSNRVGIEVDFAGNEVQYFIVESDGTKTAAGDVLAAGDGIDFDGEGIFTATLHDSSARNITAYFEEADWYGTPNTGYVALNTATLPTPTIKDGSEHFHTQLYTGTGSSGLAITNDANYGDFQPDLLWLTPRSNGDNKVFFDIARGTTKRLKSNSSDAEDTDDPAQLTFESDGFDLDTTDGNFNGSSRTYAAWQWHTQGGAGSSNTDGSINTTTTSVNTTAGISISTYTGTAATATIGHGLGAVPAMIIVKKRNAAERWTIFHRNTSNAYIYLNETFAAETSNAALRFGNDSAVVQPTSTLFTVGTSNDVNTNSNQYLAYCFAEVEGFSKFGTYEGNGSADGVFVNLNFRPAFVMLKRTDSADNWVIVDSARNPFNVANLRLLADTTNADITSTTHDFVSNGFKLRASDGGVNASGGTFIYMAFAENPFGGDGVAPATAR